MTQSAAQQDRPVGAKAPERRATGLRQDVVRERRSTVDVDLPGADQAGSASRAARRCASTRSATLRWRRAARRLAVAAAVAIYAAVRLERSAI